MINICLYRAQSHTHRGQWELVISFHSCPRRRQKNSVCAQGFAVPNIMNTIVLTQLNLIIQYPWATEFEFMPQSFLNSSPTFALCLPFICFCRATVNNESLLWLTDASKPLCLGIMGAGLGPELYRRYWMTEKIKAFGNLHILPRHKKDWSRFL